MLVTLYYNDFRIEVFDDSAFNSKSPDSPSSYDHVYYPKRNSEYASHSQHAIVVYKNDTKVVSAILLGYSGATSVSDDSVFIDGDNIIIRCSNNAFSLALPDLKLNWMTEVDWATCFSIQLYQNTYITHGELEVCRIERNGKKLWCFGGADIFLMMDGTNAFEMQEDRIVLRDLNGWIYIINYDGKVIKHGASKW